MDKYDYFIKLPKRDDEKTSLLIGLFAIVLVIILIGIIGNIDIQALR